MNETRRQIGVIRQMIEVLNKLKYLVGLQEKDFEAFKRDMRQRESGNNYQAANTLGYLGAYQFGMARLSDFGLCVRGDDSSFYWVSPYSKEYFLDSKTLQDSIFLKHCKDLKEKIIKKYEFHFNKNWAGVRITLSGLIAGAHLGGMGGLDRFFSSWGPGPKDAYGTSVRDYISLFSGYDLLKV